MNHEQDSILFENLLHDTCEMWMMLKIAMNEFKTFPLDTTWHLSHYYALLLFMVSLIMDELIQQNPI